MKIIGNSITDFVVKSIRNKPAHVRMSELE